MSRPPKPMDGYVRVSRVAGREGDTFISPEDQRDSIQKWADLKGVEVAQIFDDLDVSGGTFDRPGLDEAMERIRAGVSGGIVVAKLDRLSRAGVADALKLVEEIEKHNAQLAAIDVGIDPTTPFGEFGLTIMLGLARMERRRIEANWKTAQQRAIDRGVYIASKAPTGYLREGGRLVPNSHAGEIREVFKMRAAGASWRECCDYFNAKGVVGPWGKSNWQADAISRIIKNRAYLGESRFGEFVNKEAHKPLIDPATWKAAQRAPVASTPRSAEGALLAGFIRCAGCRYLMKPSSINLRGKRVRKYECGKEFAMGRCSKPATVLGHVVEPHVISHFRDLIGSPKFVQEQNPEALESADRDLARAEHILASYLEDTELQDTLGMERYRDGLDKRMADVRELEERVDGLQRESVGLSTAALTDLFDHGTVKDKRELLRSVIGSVFVRNVGRKAPIAQRAVILRHADLPDDLPRRGKRVPIRSFPWPDDSPV